MAKSRLLEIKRTAIRKIRTISISKKMITLVVITLIAIGFGATAIYYYNQNNNSKKEVSRLSNPQEAAKSQLSNVLAKVGQLVDLPTGETPTLATVTDPTKLTNQAFFASTKTGDQVLIYTQAKKAILYRPSTNKIIEIAPVNIGNTPGATQSGQ